LLNYLRQEEVFKNEDLLRGKRVAIYPLFKLEMVFYLLLISGLLGFIFIPFYSFELK
jgi:hypothetical protein